MKSLSIIKSEHRNLSAILFSLDKLVDEIQKGKKPKFKVFHGLLTYIDGFLDTFHHPKENQYLFPILRIRYPEADSVLAQLEQEHVDGEKLLAEMLRSLSAYEFIGDSVFSSFRDAVKRYTDFERGHALREEKQVLPLAREKLRSSDWHEIDAAFTNNKDPLFGKNRTAEFEELYTIIATDVPAPYGFGPKWQNSD